PRVADRVLLRGSPAERPDHVPDRPGRAVGPSAGQALGPTGLRGKMGLTAQSPTMRSAEGCHTVAQYIYVLEKARKAHGDKVVLDDVTLSFLPGAKIGVVGPNGAGKSSLLRIMADHAD